jgi:hypothetical protein
MGDRLVIPDGWGPRRDSSAETGDGLADAKVPREPCIGRRAPPRDDRPKAAVSPLPAGSLQSLPRRSTISEIVVGLLRNVEAPGSEAATLKGYTLAAFAMAVLCLAAACGKAALKSEVRKDAGAEAGGATKADAGEMPADLRGMADLPANEDRPLSADLVVPLADAATDVPAARDLGPDTLGRDNGGLDTSGAGGKDSVGRDVTAEAAGPSACLYAPGGLLPMERVGYNPTSVILDDVNLDGTVDAVVANSSSQTVSVLLGRGDGTFAAGTDYQAGSPRSDDAQPQAGPSYAALGDMNHDGVLDIVAVNNTVGTVSVLLGKGDGTFAGKTDFAAGEKPSWASLGDLNGDGALDLVASNTRAGTVSVLLGKGDGSFAEPVAYGCGKGPVTVAVDDLDGDGKLDLVTANQSGGTVGVLLGRGDGSFGEHGDFAGGESPSRLALGDLNGDGRLDLVVASGAEGTVAVLLAGPGGSFAQPTSYAAVEGIPALLSLTDMDRDGRLDLVVASRDGCSVNVLLGHGDGTFLPPTGYSIPCLTSAGALADLNGDGGPDIVLLGSFEYGRLSPVLGNGRGGFVSNPEYPALDSARAMAVGDLNGDGRLDVVTLSVLADYGGRVGVRLGSDGMAFSARTDYVTSDLPVALALGDVTGDGKVDIVTAHYQAKSINLLLGAGDGTFSVKGNLTTVDKPAVMAVVDVNGDGKMDIVTAGSQSDDAGSVSVLLSKGGGDFAAAVDLPSGPSPQSLTVADLNDDGRLDLVVGCTDLYGGGLFVFLGRGDGTFSGKRAYDEGSGLGALALFDLNGDRRLDIVTGQNEIRVLLGQGDGSSFVRGDIYPVAGTIGSIAIGDVTGDGAPDIVADNGPAMSLLQGRGDGSFAAPISYSVACNLPVLADMNGDGRLDIVALVGLNVTVLPSSCLGCQSSGICGPAPILNLPRK